MKNMKKLFCALLVVATVVCFMPTMAFAGNDTGATTTGGTTTGGTTTGGTTTGGTTTGGTTTGGTTTGGTTTGGTTTGGTTTGGTTTGGTTTGGTTTGGTTTGGTTTGGTTTGGTTTGGTTTGGTTTGGTTTGGTDPSYPIIIGPGTPTNPATPTEPEEVDVKGQIDKIDLVARSVKGSAQGKKAIKVYWYEKDGDDLSVLDGYEVFRSTKRYSGYGTKAFFKTERTKYWNTTIESGVKYYYKVRGFAEVNGETIYTNWSLKAWRIA